MAPAKQKKSGFEVLNDGLNTPVGKVTWKILALLCVLSYTPLGQSLMDKAGLKTANAEMVAMNSELTETKANVKSVDAKVGAVDSKVETMDKKVNALVVETERLKLEAQKLALKNP